MTEINWADYFDILCKMLDEIDYWHKNNYIPIEGYTGGRLSGGEERKGIPNMAEIPAEEIENILDDVPEEEIIESGL